MSSTVNPRPRSKPDPWVEAKRKHHLSDRQVAMAKELGMNPKKLGKLDNHKQEPWKAPLPEFIEHAYRKRFRRDKQKELDPPT